jgi:hypothetical protein
MVLNLRKTSFNDSEQSAPDKPNIKGVLGKFLVRNDSMT